VGPIIDPGQSGIGEDGLPRSFDGKKVLGAATATVLAPSRKFDWTLQLIAHAAYSIGPCGIIRITSL